MNDAQVLMWVQGCAGRIRLNRPGALNALSHGMVLASEAELELWLDDPAVRLILLDAEGERAFCAGGDIVAIWHAAKDGRPEAERQFWRDEYRLNLKLAEYAKPIVSCMDGITMGGGVGLGCHPSHRIVGESTRMALPDLAGRRRRRRCRGSPRPAGDRRIGTVLIQRRNPLIHDAT